MSEVSAKFCAACGAGLPSGAKFCPQCGGSLGNFHRGAPIPWARLVPLVAIVSLLVWGVGWWWGGSIAGEKPTIPHAEWVAKNRPELNDPALEALRKSVADSPQSKEPYRALAEGLLAKLENADPAPPQLVFELIDTLREILARDQNDTFALVAMADISLNQQVFPKAVEYFERYLAAVPSDDTARARYASALSFSGRADDAISQLQSILARDPSNFHASAYLAVTYAQMGKREEAINAGERAIQFAPNEEARARMGTFMESVRSGTLSGAPSSAPVPTAREVADASGPSLASVEAFLKGHEIAGRKFVKLEFAAGALRIFMKEFPMDKMPPVIRDKFVNSVLERARTALGGSLDRIVFVDAASDREMVAQSSLPQ